MQFQKHLEVQRDLTQRGEQQPHLLTVTELGGRRGAHVGHRYLSEVEPLSLAVPVAQELTELTISD